VGAATGLARVIPYLVVPTLTRHDLLGRMLESVDHPIGTLVVIDNSGLGFDVPDGPWERAHVLPLPVNLGVAASWNLAVRIAHREPYVLICSDDVEWPAGSLERFAASSSEDSVVLSSTWPHWCAFSLGMTVVASVGLFDEGYFPAYFEDLDYARRMERGGITVEHGPPVTHRNSSTLRSSDAFVRANDRSWAANSALFERDQLHGFDPYRWRDQAWT